MRCYLDDQTAMWLRRHCDSFTPKKTEQIRRQALLDALSRDDDGCYLDLKTIDKKLLAPIAISLARGSWEQSYQDAFLRIANEVARYAGLSAIEKLAEIVDPKSTNIEGEYDGARTQLADRIRERRERGQALQAKAQDPGPRPGQRKFPRPRH